MWLLSAPRFAFPIGVDAVAIAKALREKGGMDWWVPQASLKAGGDNQVGVGL